MDRPSVTGLRRIWSCLKNTKRRYSYLDSWLVWYFVIVYPWKVNSKSVNHFLDVSCSPEEFWIWLRLCKNRSVLKDTYLDYSAPCLGATALSHWSFIYSSRYSIHWRSGPFYCTSLSLLRGDSMSVFQISLVGFVLFTPFGRNNSKAFK